ncbi:glycoside hydrolase family 43 protein [Catenovulum adriaticum]|uniref:Glycoside hydrolase family 43 protein n=1 Tax=Catenovulum adriaticum TaxID=2984846 RepID=A0ABY7AT23_9ALTE|nr:glycoside hydrolase family 43 protein [Catenovulum sp. TS8]WAJ71922.1 glycoside hydrolase family 43 protein [Catenovulum sp. TS8]
MQLKLNIKQIVTVASITAAALIISSCYNAKVENPSQGSSVSKEKITEQPQGLIQFEYFEYQGKDPVYKQPLSPSQYFNPIISGFYPDPSITRRGNDFYIVTSSFAYLPGLPIFHSQDLINWQLIGHGLTSQNAIDFSNIQVSDGIYAPTIRYHNGLFYIISTAVHAGGNFIITAKDPAGPWSKPNWLPEVGGIDPDIFFDDDGRVYITHNDAPPSEPLYDGHRAIWIWEYDLSEQKVIADSKRLLVDGGVDIRKKPIWIEGPHIYKINDWYYLLCAEGGTAKDHSEVVFRTKNLSEPFVPYKKNPILTQRDLNPNRENPITTAGHADLVQLDNGQWWAVFLATRAYEQYLFNTGRETFLLPVTWQDDWPIILPAGQQIPYIADSPLGMPRFETRQPVSGNFIWRDDFNNNELKPGWTWLRDYLPARAKINHGSLELSSNKEHLTHGIASFIGKRQQHQTFTASTKLKLPSQVGISAGMVAFQNEKFNYYFAVKKAHNGYQVFVEQSVNGVLSTLAVSEVLSLTDGDPITFFIDGKINTLDLYFEVSGRQVTFLKNVDATVLSTEKAGGFVGAMIGLHSRIE